MQQLKPACATRIPATSRLQCSVFVCLAMGDTATQCPTLGLSCPQVFTPPGDEWPRTLRPHQHYECRWTESSSERRLDQTSLLPSLILLLFIQYDLRAGFILKRAPTILFLPLCTWLPAHANLRNLNSQAKFANNFLFIHNHPLDNLFS